MRQGLRSRRQSGVVGSHVRFEHRACWASVGSPLRGKCDRPDATTSSSQRGDQGATWEFLDQMDLGDVFLQRILVLKQCPRFLRGRLRFCFFRVFCENAIVRSWQGILWRRVGLGSFSVWCPSCSCTDLDIQEAWVEDELCHRADEFVKGKWADLLNDAQDHAVRQPRRSPHGHDDKARRGAAGQSRVQRGQVSRGRHELTMAPWAPRNNVTLEGFRRQRPQDQQSAITKVVLGFFSRTSCAVSAPSVCGLPQIRTFGQRLRTKKVHVRVFACLFGRPRNSRSALFSRRGFRNGSATT